ncbi:ribonuclease P protein subunit p25-like protein isoform X2 [Gigantopelta aegis]|nr:ribonuclease P protein subunit p25-like protein isoform X2 [Gigantopelta aegis]XP_041365739.1 ribonuclease P protein subunit p25-like protein isoform X2 [Gigantopelta aegis]
MENYEKGETREVDEELPFGSYSNVVQMKVTAGSKIKNVIGYALKKLQEPEVRYLSWNGSGHAVTKTVTCAEITKKKFKGLQQITKIRFKRIEEFWEPKLEGLERLKVNRDIPAISVLLSKDPLDKLEPGFQCHGSLNALWSDSSPKKKTQRKQKPRGAVIKSQQTTFPKKDKCDSQGKTLTQKKDRCDAQETTLTQKKDKCDSQETTLTQKKDKCDAQGKQTSENGVKINT